VSSGVKPNTAWRKGLPCKWTCTVQKHRTHTQGMCLRRGYLRARTITANWVELKTVDAQQNA
jgi:hypothetical protein